MVSAAAALGCVGNKDTAGADPVDIAGDADEERYAVALQHLLEDDANDAVLVMNVPTALASPAAAATSVIAVTEEHRKARSPAKPVFAVWIGGSDPGAEAFDAAGIPSYATESDAVGGFMHLVQYRQSREQLMATPPSMPQDFAPGTQAGRATHCRRVRRPASRAAGDAGTAGQRRWPASRPPRRRRSAPGSIRSK